MSDIGESPSRSKHFTEGMLVYEALLSEEPRWKVSLPVA